MEILTMMDKYTQFDQWPLQDVFSEEFFEKVSILDRESDRGYARLAEEILDFTWEDIQKLENKDNRTKEVLVKWSQCDAHSTVGTFLEALITMGRLDVHRGVIEHLNCKAESLHRKKLKYTSYISQSGINNHQKMTMRESSRYSRQACCSSCQCQRQVTSRGRTVSENDTNMVRGVCPPTCGCHEDLDNQELSNHGTQCGMHQTRSTPAMLSCYYPGSSGHGTDGSFEVDEKMGDQQDSSTGNISYQSQRMSHPYSDDISIELDQGDQILKEHLSPLRERLSRLRPNERVRVLVTIIMFCLHEIVTVCHAVVQSDYCGPIDGAPWSVIFHYFSCFKEIFLALMVVYTVYVLCFTQYLGIHVLIVVLLLVLIFENKTVSPTVVSMRRHFVTYWKIRFTKQPVIQFNDRDAKIRKEIEDMQRRLQRQLLFFIVCEGSIALLSVSTIISSTGNLQQVVACFPFHCLVLVVCLLEIAATILVFLCHYWRVDVELLRGRFTDFMYTPPRPPPPHEHH